MKEAESVSRNISTYDAATLVREMRSGIVLLVYKETDHELATCIHKKKILRSQDGVITFKEDGRWHRYDQIQDVIDALGRAIRCLEFTNQRCHHIVQEAQQELRDRGLAFETVKGCEHRFKEADETISSLKDLRRTCE